MTKRDPASQPPKQSVPASTARRTLSEDWSFPDEDSFRRTLKSLLALLPGVRGLRELHGAAEYGKDLVFVATGPLGEPLPCACVLKMKVTGSAESRRGSARNVLLQISQAFEKPYLDESGGDVYVQRVYVLTPQEISPQTMESIAGALKKRAGQTLFIGGQMLRQSLSRGELGLDTARRRKSARLPRVWKVPYRHIPFFVGRDSFLQRLAELFKMEPNAPIAITGLAGIGKTQLAVEYAHKHSADFSAVVWLPATDESVLSDAFASLAFDLSLPEADAGHKTAIPAVRTWFEENDRWLMIFDDAPVPEKVKRFLPHRLKNGQVLITSKSTGIWHQLARSEPLGKLEVKDAAEVVRRIANRPDEIDEALDLAQEMDGLPLALAQAGAYVNATGTTLRHYVQRFREQKGLLGHMLPSEDRSVATTWSLALSRLSEDAPAALVLLRIFAFWAPTEIPLALLREQRDLLPDELADVVADETSLDDAVMIPLRAYSLVTHSNDGFSIHRLVQKVVREHGHTGDETVNDALTIIDAAFPLRADEPRHWPDCARLLPHALSVIAYLKTPGSVDEKAACLLDRMGSYLFSRTAYGIATAAFERAKDMGRKHHPTHVIRTNNVGCALLERELFDRALYTFVEALDAAKSIFGDEHRHSAIILINIGSTCLALEQFGEAVGYFSAALRLVEGTTCEAGEESGKVFAGPSDYRVNTRPLAFATATLGLAGALHGLGRSPEALEHCRTALEVLEANLGEFHPRVAVAHQRLGCILRENEEEEAAAEHYGKAWAIWQKALALLKETEVLGLLEPSLRSLGEEHLLCERVGQGTRDALHKVCLVLSKAAHSSEARCGELESERDLLWRQVEQTTNWLSPGDASGNIEFDEVADLEARRHSLTKELEVTEATRKILDNLLQYWHDAVPALRMGASIQRPECGLCVDHCAIEVC